MATPLHEPTDTARGRDAAAEAGRLLREARLARGEELAAAAEELCIRPAHLEALEEGRLGRLLAPVYVVGHTRAYAHHLGLDGAEFARRLKAPGVERHKPEAGRRRAAASLAGLLLLGMAAYAGCRSGFQAVPGTTLVLSLAAATPASAPVTAVADLAVSPSGTPGKAAPSSTPPMAARTRPEPRRAAVADASLLLAEGAPAPGPMAAAVATAPAPVHPTDAAAPVQADEPLVALAARDDAATSEAPPAAEAGGPAPPASSPLAAEATAAGPADTAEVVNAAPASATGRFTIQVASLRDPAGAAGEWRRLVKLHPSLVGLGPHPAKAAEISGKGRFYRVLGGAFATRAEAQAACARLLAEGSYCRPVPL